MDYAVEMEEGLSGQNSPANFSGKQPKVITLNKVNYSVIDNGKDPKQKDGKRKTILKDISFYVKPGMMTLLLGAPGGGRTSLFKVMANLTAAGTQLEGDILFGGKHISPHLHHKQVAYITQEDNHLPSLSVRETLWFSSECSTGPSSKTEQNDKMERLLKMLSLKHVENTFIGNQFLRGISGGQKKRVTVGLDLLKGANVLLMDEPTTGLDSVTVVELMTCIQSLAHSTGVSVICALLQPPAEVLPLFDQLLLLNGGEVSYFGPMQDARPYFNNLGFDAIDDNEGEFFQEVITTPEDFVIDGSGSLQPDQPKNASDFARIFRESSQFRVIQSVIDEQHHNIDSHKKSKKTIKTEYVNSFWRQTYLCLWRAWKLARRDRMALYSRFFTTIFQGFYFGCSFLFMDDNQEGIENRQSMLFIASMYTTFSTMITLDDLYSQRAVFNEQRRSRKWYRALPYFIGYTSTEFVLGFLQSVLLCIIMYWLAGLADGEGRFIYLVLNHYLLYMSNFAILFAVSAMTSSAFYPGVIIPTAQLGFLILNGFVIPRRKIPGWWIWVHYSLPTTYSYEGMLINEFGGRDFKCEADEFIPPLSIANSDFQGSQICLVTNGEQVLRDKGFSPEFYFRWIDLVILVGFTSLFLFIAYLAILFTHKPTSGASGVVVSKKKKHKPKTKKETPQEHKHSREISGCELTFTDISYYVDVKGRKLQLLHNVSGYVEPGKLLALMGPSGAGKSTLLDVLAQRKRHGDVQGEILIGGRKVDNTFLRRAAYVMQTDILQNADTVREVVRFSAQCRLPRHHTAAFKDEFAEGVLRDMKLDKIGNDLVAGLTPEQKKRVNIAVELAANPQILFLDEPTSGLDSAGARNVMKCVHAFCRRNASCSIICTIHQPSEEIFSLFDSLLLMAAGGYTVYFGPLVDESGENRNNTLLEHCKSAGYIMDSGANPADFILGYAAAKSSNTDEPQIETVQGLFKYYNDSNLSKNNLGAIKDIVTSALALPISVAHPAANIITQTYQCLIRASRGFWRRRSEIVYQFYRSILFAIFLGTLFLRLDDDQWRASQNVSMIFFAISYGSLMGYTMIPTCAAERSIFYKEKDSGTYPPLAYCIAQCVAANTVNIGLAVTFMLPAFWLSGTDPSDRFTSFLFAVLAYYFSSSCFVTVGQLFAVALPSQGAAAVVFCVVEQIAILYGGFLIKTDSMVRGLSWLRYISFYKYSVESTSVQVLTGATFYCKDSEYNLIPLPNGTTQEYCHYTTGEQILELNGFQESWKWPDIGILIGEWFFLMVLFYLALKKIRYD